MGRVCGGHPGGLSIPQSEAGAVPRLSRLDEVLPRRTACSLVMIELLVSVRSAAEAEAALAGGAGLIDVKEPLRGPLGRADNAIVRSVIAPGARTPPVSAALGELRAPPPPCTRRRVERRGLPYPPSRQPRHVA